LPERQSLSALCGGKPQFSYLEGWTISSGGFERADNTPVDSSRTVPIDVSRTRDDKIIELTLHIG
jgi:hypothetical protein